MPKINVLTAKLTVHIPLDPGDIDSVLQAADWVERLRAHAASMGETTVETRVARVTAPEPEPKAPEPAADGLDIPESLRRTAKPAAAAAE